MTASCGPLGSPWPSRIRRVLAAAAAHTLAELEPTGAVVDPFDIPGGWRVGEPAWTTWRMVVTGHEPVDVRIRGRAASSWSMG